MKTANKRVHPPPYCTRCFNSTRFVAPFNNDQHSKTTTSCTPHTLQCDVFKPSASIWSTVVYSAKADWCTGNRLLQLATLSGGKCATCMTPSVQWRHWRYDVAEVRSPLPWQHFTCSGHLEHGFTLLPLNCRILWCSLAVRRIIWGKSKGKCHYINVIHTCKRSVCF